MPVYYGTASTTDMNSTGVGNESKIRFWKPLLFLTFYSNQYGRGVIIPLIAILKYEVGAFELQSLF